MAAMIIPPFPSLLISGSVRRCFFFCLDQFNFVVSMTRLPWTTTNARRGLYSKEFHAICDCWEKGIRNKTGARPFHPFEFVVLGMLRQGFFGWTSMAAFRIFAESNSTIMRHMRHRLDSLPQLQHLQQISTSVLILSLAK